MEAFDSLSCPPANVHEAIARDLIAHSCSVQAGFFDPHLTDRLLGEILALNEQGDMSRAGVGRGDAYKIDDGVRRDKTHWLGRDTLAQCRYLDQMEALRIELNRSLFLGLFEYECHFAVYEKGAFYRRHYDSFKGDANRIVTTVTYLNPDWKSEYGGFLNIYRSETETLELEVSPEAGTLVVFLSEEIPHEVTLTHRRRASIAGWYRCNNSLGGVIDPIS